MRVDLPSGRWIELRAASGITERQRRPIRRAMAKFSDSAKAAMDAGNLAADSFTAADQDVMFEVNDYVAVALIATASFAEPGLPVTVDDLADLPAADYDKLTEAVGPHIGSVMAGVDFDPTPDRSSPTPPSSD